MRLPHALAIALIALCSLTMSARTNAADIVFPTLTGPVVDLVDEIPHEQEAALTAKLLSWQKTTGHQFVIVTVPHMQGQDIKDYALMLGRSWGIGRGGADDGVILLHALKERKVRIEVGRGLEPILTDAVTARIIRNILTHFKAKDFPRGIDQGAAEIMLQGAITPEQKAEDDRRIAARQEAIQQKLRDGVLNILGFLLSIGIIASICYGIWWMATLPRRAKQAREKAIQDAARQAELAAEAEAAAAREQAQREETERKRKEQAARVEEERRAYEEMLANETPRQRRARLKKEAALEKARQDQAKRARTEREERDRIAQQQRATTSSKRIEPEPVKPAKKAEDTSFNSGWASSSADSSSSDYGGGGGDFGGGGSDGGY